MLAQTLDDLYAKQSNQWPLSELSYREKIWKEFIATGLPSTKTHGFDYVLLEPLKNTSFTLDHDPICFEHEIIDQSLFNLTKESSIVLVDGKFCEQLSSADTEDLIICSLSQAKKQFGSYIKAREISHLQTVQDPFAMLNMALYGEGLFIYVPKGKIIEKPIQILNIISGNFIIHPKVYLYVGKEASIDIINSTNHLSEEKSLVNAHIDINLEEGAKCLWIEEQFLTKKHQNLFNHITAQVKRDGSFVSTLLSRGGALYRNGYQVYLNDENASCELYGMSSINNNNQSHVHALVKHFAKNTRSNQLFKSLVSDKGRFSFEGKIFVTENALGTFAYQLNNNLLLSDQAVAFSKPGLEIFADDVKASHGSTTAQLDEEELFYLLSRGIQSEEAKKLLVNAFAREIIEKAQHKEIQDVSTNILTC